MTYRALFIIGLAFFSLTARAELVIGESQHVCFTPQENCTQLIVDAIDNAQDEILVQAYSFTSKPITDALLHAYQRQVSIKVILDKSQTTQKYSTIKLLDNNHIPLWIDHKVAIAHNKVMIIDRRLVITGSFNFTQGAQMRNAENLLLITSPILAERYESNWHFRQEKSLAYVDYIHNQKPNKIR